MTQNPTISVGQWIGKITISAIPLVGQIVLIAWIRNDKTPSVVKHWAHAVLNLQAMILYIYFLSLSSN